MIKGMKEKEFYKKQASEWQNNYYELLNELKKTQALLRQFLNENTNLGPNNIHVIRAEERIMDFTQILNENPNLRPRNMHLVTDKRTGEYLWAIDANEINFGSGRQNLRYLFTRDQNGFHFSRLGKHPDTSGGIEGTPPFIQ